MFSQRLKQLRRENKVTQGDLAKVLEVDRTSITKWETTDVMPDGLTLSIIAKHFSVSIEYLIGTSNDKRRIEDFYSPSLEKVITHAEMMNLTKSRRDALEKLKRLPLSKQQSLLDETISDLNDLPDEEKESVVKFIRAYLASR